MPQNSQKIYTVKNNLQLINQNFTKTNLIYMMIHYISDIGYTNILWEQFRITFQFILNFYNSNLFVEAQYKSFGILLSCIMYHNLYKTKKI